MKKGNFFNQKKTELIAVNNVDIKARYGETIGIVGESGSGKSTLGMSLIKLQDINSGKIFLSGSPAATFNNWKRSGAQKQPPPKGIWPLRAKSEENR